ncbi:MAG: hypothetical protein EOO12_12885 [Chitinophagaceae bacterium]|nr:MAG: hypothetical protein EOO12_12885 [Chitinophagaceae bacterium]
MKNIILPIDFSECSLEMAKYSLRMFEKHPDVRLVLYYLYHSPENGESAYRAFESVRFGLPPEYLDRIETYAEEGEDFPTSICAFSKRIEAVMIVTCLSRKTLKLVENNPCPIMIIPSNIGFREIRTVAIASDFHHVERDTPVEAIRPILDLFHPELHIVNVNSDFYITLSEQYETERQKLAELFRDYDPEFDFLSMYDYQESIRLFVEEKQIDLLITIPHHHGFVADLFREHHTVSLVMNSPIPVLAAHD